MNKTLLLLSLASTILFAANGAELIKTNCASCHLLTSPTPDIIPTLEAPALERRTKRQIFYLFGSPKF